jgi:hypothetical protein
VTVPIACTLSETAARSQLGEWHELLAAIAVGSDRVSPTEVRFRLGDDLGRLGELVRLAQREKACCEFFDFRLLIDSGAVALGVSVPPEAVLVLDDFAGTVRQ